MAIAQSVQEISVRVPIDDIELEGDLVIPEHAHGVVLFAHGSGSSRFSSRNRFVASELNHRRLATLLIDLLTPHEEAIDEYSAELRFDIPMLAHRLVGAAEWLTDVKQLRQAKIGLFGASTGGGAALVAAAEIPDYIAAVVSRGGRPDLAGSSLPKVQAPTLLIVGGEDDIVIDLNREAMEQMRCEVKLEIVPGATHLFEEHGALERVAELAGEWFEKFL